MKPIFMETENHKKGWGGGVTQKNLNKNEG
jgi:hypothetical protein